ncbi:hypothetical protein GCM10010363_02070 [Streptomyces omiyaensis]|uniref:hypothetical protein n=1 Tax=Streptomyces omiyaensis TaxID=68247 RepID=UPI00167247CD|nr:hypothetical protein [Streptomyces omiyaensis]GGY25398.1 hypothetical protein GCM10010363_02070 [Streptomyces omiyaensis]
METDENIRLRQALEHAAAELPPLPDLAPLAVREGRRRRARARFAVATTAFGAVTAGALGIALPPGSDPAPATPAAVPSSPAPSASPGASYPPVVVEATPGVTPPDNPDGLSPAERERRAAHQQRVAALLDELLPEKVTGIRPVKDEVAVYRITAGGASFRMAVSVRPTDEPLAPCPDLPEERGVCETVAFDGDREAQLMAMPVNGPDTTGSYLRFSYGKSRVLLSVDPEAVSAPVTPRELLDVAADPRFLDLVEDTDARPVETKEPRPVAGG